MNKLFHFELAFNELNDFTEVDSHLGSTGYYENLTDVKLGTDMLRFTDKHNRRGIILPIIDGGNIVVFERFTGGDNDVLVANYPSWLGGYSAMLGLSGAVGDGQFQSLAGFGYRGEEGERVPAVAYLLSMSPEEMRRKWVGETRRLMEDDE